MAEGSHESVKNVDGGIGKAIGTPELWATREPR